MNYFIYVIIFFMPFNANTMVYEEKTDCNKLIMKEEIIYKKIEGTSYSGFVIGECKKIKKGKYINGTLTEENWYYIMFNKFLRFMELIWKLF